METGFRMIAFDLECSKNHLFEGWFNSFQSFEEQKTRELVRCPYCNDTRIRRVISPVAVKSSSRADEEREPMPIDYPRLAREIINYVNKNFDNVGANFTKEALKMHYGVTEKRNIRGSATAEEEKTLRDEKIEYFKVPHPVVEDKKKN
jgi:hypothetical protein